MEEKLIKNYMKISITKKYTTNSRNFKEKWPKKFTEEMFHKN